MLQQVTTSYNNVTAAGAAGVKKTSRTPRERRGDEKKSSEKEHKPVTIMSSPTSTEPEDLGVYHTFDIDQIEEEKTELEIDALSIESLSLLPPGQALTAFQLGKS